MRRSAVERPLAFTRNASSWQAAGLHAWWPLLTDTRDHVRSRSGSLQGNAAFQQPGSPAAIGYVTPQAQLVRCVGLDGAGDYVDAGPLPFLTAPFTLACWFRQTTELTDEYQGLITRGGVFVNDTNFAFCVRPPARRVVCYWRNGATLYGNETADNAYRINFPWVHVAAVIADNWDVTFYADGQSVGSDGGNAAPSDGGQNVRLGGSSDGNAELIGQLADCRIYRRALSAPEVRQLYAPETRWDLYAPTSRRLWLDAPAAAAGGPNLSAMGGSFPIRRTYRPGPFKPGLAR